VQAVSNPTDRSTGLKYASVCDGIGAAHVAWQPLGWKCQWTSEIEPFPVAVVEHHYGFRNLGDMTAITEEMLDEHGPVDLLAGGCPCQSFSVAGLRGGLADPRGNLSLRFCQLAAVMRPRWVVFENVPGLLSSGKGRDFGTFLGALGELGYGFAYRILDAQWFGVAQRRRRVFVVGYLGDWRRAAAVLFERESVFGHPPTRGKAWEGVACATPVSTRTGRSDDRGDECDNLVAEPQAIAFGGQMSTPQVDVELSQTLQRKNPQAVAVDTYNQAIGDVSIPLRVGNAKDSLPAAMVPFTKSKRAQSTTDDETWVPGEVSPTMSCFDQGDTRATTVVAVQDCSGREKQQNGKGWNDDGTAYTVDAAATQGVAIDLQNVSVGGDVAGTLDTTRPSRGGGQAVAQGFTYSGYSNQPAWMTGDRTDCLPASGHSDGSHQGVGVATAMAVRRLTPRECERLQGFPDDYTLVQYRKKPAADGPRYRALGNSMAVPVMRWIGERIAMVDRM
jgi:DNA (cytosine-5)-methyltransferase 1